MRFNESNELLSNISSHPSSGIALYYNWYVALINTDLRITYEISVSLWK